MEEKKNVTQILYNFGPLNGNVERQIIVTLQQPKDKAEEAETTETTETAEAKEEMTGAMDEALATDKAMKYWRAAAGQDCGRALRLDGTTHGRCQGERLEG